MRSIAMRAAVGLLLALSASAALTVVTQRCSHLGSSLGSLLGTPACAAEEKQRPAETAEQIARAQELLELLDASNKLEVKSAIEELGKLRTQSARDILVKYIKKSKNVVWGTYAIRALGWSGNKEAVDFLCGKEGVRAKNVLLAEASCQALVAIGDKRAIPTLIEATKSKKVVVTRAAIKAVVRLDRGAEGLADLMIKMAKRKESQVREAVADAMSSLSDERVIEPLIKMATRDGNSLVRLQACRSLGSLRASEARAAMEVVAKKDKSMEVRAAARTALGQIPATAGGK
jgi:HEAT repeat protein